MWEAVGMEEQSSRFFHDKERIMKRKQGATERSRVSFAGKAAGRYLSVFLCLFLIAGMLKTTSFFSLATSSRELENRQRKLQNQMEQNRAGITNANQSQEDARQEQGELNEAIGETDRELSEVVANVGLIQKEIDKKQSQIDEIQVKVDEETRKEGQLYAEMKERIRFLFEQGDMRYVQILLEAQNFSDMVNKAAYIQKLYAYDKKQLDAYEKTRKTAAAYQAQLEDEKSELETTLYEHQEERTHMNQMLAQYRSRYADADARIARAQADAEAYAAKVEEQAQQVDALTDKIAQAKEREEEQRLAEEAKKKAEAEAKARAQQEAEERKRQEGNSGEEGNGGGEEDRPQKEEKTYAPAGSASGTNIANFATQFVGCPYVAGGTSLTNGADCSGFVWAVYKEFGIRVPRTSWSLAMIGQEVSLDTAQPGDLVCYPGHVGIYIGNGCIVHASSARTGIKISNATYRAISSVRRIL